MPPMLKQVTKYATLGLRTHTLVALQSSYVLVSIWRLEAGHYQTWFGAFLARRGKDGLRQSTSNFSNN
jgi:hypothetical protein